MESEKAKEKKSKQANAHVSPLHYPMVYTFGVEFEFLAAYDSSTMGAYDFDFSRKGHDEYRRDHVHTYIRKLLRQVGVDLVRPKSSYRGWSVDSDTTLKPSKPSQVMFQPDFIGVEITSPPLQLDKKGFAEVEKVLSILNDNLEIEVNKTCGFHVHIGGRLVNDKDPKRITRSRGFPLQTIRNHILLTTFFEQQINTLHPVRRTTMSGHDARWCIPPSWEFRHMPPGAVPLFLERDTAFSRLEHRVERRGLAGNDGGKPAYKYHYLLPSEDQVWDYGVKHISDEQGEDDLPITDEDHSYTRRACRTIEFRQHRATVNFTKVKPWIKLVARFIQFAHECGPEGLPIPLLLRAHDPRFTLDDFLRAISVEPKVRRYYTDPLRTREAYDTETLHTAHKAWNFPTPESPKFLPAGDRQRRSVTFDLTNKPGKIY